MSVSIHRIEKKAKLRKNKEKGKRSGKESSNEAGNEVDKGPIEDIQAGNVLKISIELKFRKRQVKMFENNFSFFGKDGGLEKRAQERIKERSENAS